MQVDRDEAVAAIIRQRRALADIAALSSLARRDRAEESDVAKMPESGSSANRPELG
jgi:hypothetical protein